jgi:hypothetical protein
MLVRVGGLHDKARALATLGVTTLAYPSACIKEGRDPPALDIEVRGRSMNKQSPESQVAASDERGRSRASATDAGLVADEAAAAASTAGPPMPRHVRPSVAGLWCRGAEA